MRSFPLAEYEARVPVRIGSLSQCFAARSASGEEVLLKQLLPAYARVPSIAAAWLQRAEQNASLDHPGCSKVLDWGEALGESYLTLPRVAAASLRELSQAAAKVGVWPRVEAVVAIARGALSALAYAQAEFALVHLDLDPHALLLRKDGSVLLTEFGMWRALPAEAATRERFDRGRVAYLCPELTKSLEGDPRSDVFSLGAVLYELLGKERPFHGATQLVTAMAIAEGRRRPLRELAPHAPDVLCDIIETMLAHEPDERFQSAQAALGAFSSCGEADPAALVEWLDSLALRAGPQAGFARAPRIAAPSAPAPIGDGAGRAASAERRRDIVAAPPPFSEDADAPALTASRRDAGATPPLFGAGAPDVAARRLDADVAPPLFGAGAPDVAARRLDADVAPPLFGAGAPDVAVRRLDADVAPPLFGAGAPDVAVRRLHADVAPPLCGAGPLEVGPQDGVCVAPLLSPSAGAREAARSAHGNPPSPPAPLRADGAPEVSGGDDWIAPPPLLSPRAPARAQVAGAPGPEVRDGHTAFLDVRAAASPRAADAAPARPPPAEMVARAPSRASSATAQPAPVQQPPAAEPQALLGRLLPSLVAHRPASSLPSPERDAPHVAVERAWQEPSNTVFQAKVFARHATRRRAARAPLLVVVLLSVAFGFAAVAGGTLLWRLIAS